MSACGYDDVNSTTSMACITVIDSYGLENKHHCRTWTTLEMINSLLLMLTLKSPPWTRAKKRPEVTAFPAWFGPPMPLTIENMAPEPKAATMLQWKVHGTKMKITHNTMLISDPPNFKEIKPKSNLRPQITRENHPIKINEPFPIFFFRCIKVWMARFICIPIQGCLHIYI